MVQVRNDITPAVEKITEDDDIRFDGDYIGVAKVGSLTSEAKWQIFKVTSSGLCYADNEVRFIKVWDNRASYSYSI